MSKAALVCLSIFISLTAANAQFTTSILRERSYSWTSHVLTSRAGDVDGDGIPDFLSSVNGYLSSTGLFDGAIQLISGRDGTLLFEILNEPGRSISDVGDVNGDGFDDLIVGNPLDSTNGIDSGVARIYSGLDQAILHVFHGSTADTFTGKWVCGMGDLDGDGAADFAVGEQTPPVAGGIPGSQFLINLISGATGNLIQSILGPIGSDGASDISNCGDVNGDGADDLIVGAFGDASTPDTFYVNVYSGQDGTIIHSISNAELGGAFAIVEGLGDTNYDGFGDFIVGNPGFYSGVLFRGRARVYSGFDGSVLRTIESQHSSHFVAKSVAGLGDIDGDGAGDYAVSQDFNPNPFIRIFSGATNTSLGTLPTVKDFAVRRLGDVNGDGKNDILLGVEKIGVSIVPPLVRQRVYLSGITPVTTYVSSSGIAPSLDLRWEPEFGNDNDDSGALICNGATAGASGIVLVSLAPADIPIFGFDLLAAVDPINLVFSPSIGANLVGRFSALDIPRRNAAIAGSSLHVQFIETFPNIRASNAIRFIVIP